MKKLIVIILAMNFLQSLHAQVGKEKDQSNAEKFSQKSGSLIQREYEDIGTVKRCKIQLATFHDLITDAKLNAIRFEYEYHSTYSTDSKIAVLDADEIDGLIKSIKLIQEKILPKNPTIYTEVAFKSRSGFSAGCYSGKDKWSTFMKLEEFDSNSYLFMDKDDLSQLLTILEQVKTKM